MLSEFGLSLLNRSRASSSESSRKSILFVGLAYSYICFEYFSAFIAMINLI